MDGLWGSPVGRNKWNGMVEVVRTGEADVGAAAFTITEERQRAIDFSIPFDLQPHGFIASRPDEISRALLFIQPFQTSTWVKKFVFDFFFYFRLSLEFSLRISYYLFFADMFFMLCSYV